MDPVMLINVLTIGVLAMLVARWLTGAGDHSAEALSRRLSGKSSGMKSAAPSNTAALVHGGGNGGLESVAAALAKPLQGNAYERTQLSLKLAQAGYRHPDAVTAFLAGKFALAAVGLAVAWLLQMKFGPSRAIWYERFAWPLGGFCVGFYLPQLWLNSTAGGRSERIGRGLADSLDMLVVMVEAGLGLDAAIQRCSDEMQKAYPDIADEWRLASKETQMGLSRGEALRKMADRTGVCEMRSLVAIITQAERFGTSIAQALRVHAEALRTKRRQQAEEAAAKTAVKLIFPLILCIFPTIFIVLAGPAVLKIMETIK